MAGDPIFCFPGDSLQRGAELLRSSGGALIPVIRDRSSRRFLGVLCEGRWIEIARRNSPTDLRVRDFMTLPPLIGHAGDDPRRLLPQMRRFGVSRVPILNHDGTLAGMYGYPRASAEQAGLGGFALSAAAFAIGALLMLFFEPAHPGPDARTCPIPEPIPRTKRSRTRARRQEMRLTATALGGGLAMYAVRGRGPLTKATAMLGMGMLARGLTHGKGDES